MPESTGSGESAEFAKSAESGGAAHRTWGARACDPERIVRLVLPAVVLLAALGGWEASVRLREVPSYILPAPSLIVQTLVADWAVLSGSLLVTLKVTLGALAIATLGGVGLAVLFAQSKWLELSLFPYVVILQGTPVISIAPLIFI